MPARSRFGRFAAFTTLAFVLAASRVASAEPEPLAEQRPRWVFVTVEQDFSWLDGSTPCSPESQQNGSFACFRANGSQYLGTPRRGDRSRVGPGFLPSTTRVLVGYTHFLTSSFALGGRVGFAVRGGSPRSVGEDARAFLPVHLEMQATWSPPLLASSHGGFRGLILASGGVAQFDGHARLDVREDPSVPPPASQLDNPASQSLDVYRKSGIGFGALGVGFVARIYRDWLGRVALQGIASFPSTGYALALEAGIGFDLSPSRPSRPSSVAPRL